MQITIEKPQLSVSACLIIDDPAPCINPFYYFRLQVDHEGWEHHERLIPLDFLQQFADVCRTRGMRGKFSILPYPAGLGSILDGWEGCDCAEIAAWLDVVRREIAPNFDITPEILTHTLALDLRTHTLLPQSEHEWMGERSVDDLKAYMGAALAILKAADFAPTGITQPCSFSGSRADYARAVMESIHAINGPPVTHYFIDGYFEPPPVPDHEVMLLDRARGEAVVSIIAYCNDYFWPTQHTTNKCVEDVADGLITADGRGGRLAELADANAWLTIVCHWQTLFSDGSREGLKALDEVAARLTRTHGSRLRWFTLSEIARYRAASEACQIDVHPNADGWRIALDAAFDCPNFTISITAPELDRIHINLATVQVKNGGEHKTLVNARGAELLPSSGWRQEGNCMSLCFDLRRGQQVIQLSHAA